MAMINEDDMTRRMIGTINNTSRIIKESVENNSEDANGGMDNSDAIELPKSERQPFEEQFKQIVDSSTRFDVFNIYPKARNVVFGGTIQGMSGIEFQMTLEDNDGVYISGNNIQITSDFVDKIKRLQGFYEEFREDCFEMLDNDYKDRS